MFVWTKSAEFAPAKVIAAIPTGTFPVFETVMICAALVVPAPCGPKVRLIADRAIDGATPVPIRETICGLPLALSLRFKLAFLAPIDVGEKLIDTVQFVPGATTPLAGQGLLPA